MRYSLSELAHATGLTAVGNTNLVVRAAAEPAQARPDDLALAMAPAFADAMTNSNARAAVLWDGADWEAMGVEGALIAPKPRVALALVTGAFQHPTDTAPGIHPTAVIDPSADVGIDAAIGPFALIGARAKIGRNAVIGAHVSIGSDAELGDRALLHDGVRIGARCRIGHDFIALANAVIGADGFSFEPPQKGNVEVAKRTGTVDGAAQTPRFLRIHSLSAVEIGDDVEIGACTTIDRGTISPTRIGTGTKIDNQVQIGHNVQVGQTCLLCAQVGIAGSSVLGDRVVLGGKTGIADHVNVGSDVVCAAATMVASNIPARSVMMGMPATPRDKTIQQFMAIKRLPRLAAQVAEIRAKLGL